MHSQAILRTALLAFVVGAVAVMIVREVRDEGPAAERNADAAVALPADGLVVNYFHGNVRCPTCETIESLALEAVTSRLSEGLAAGTVAWRVLNYETPANAHFATDYEIAAPTVVLVRRTAGADGAWTNLTRVWELVGDKPAFIDYVAEEATNLLK